MVENSRNGSYFLINYEQSMISFFKFDFAHFMHWNWIQSFGIVPLQFWIHGHMDDQWFHWHFQMSTDFDLSQFFWRHHQWELQICSFQRHFVAVLCEDWTTCLECSPGWCSSKNLSWNWVQSRRKVYLSLVTVFKICGISWTPMGMEKMDPFS